MPQVDINIGKREYHLMCDAGQESHLQQLAGKVNEKVELLSGQLPGSTDMLLLVMSSLMLQDELDEQRAANDGASPVSDGEDVDGAVTEAITAIAQYVETIAERIEKA